MPNSYSQDIKGEINGLGRDGRLYHLNPKIRQQTSTQSRRQGGTTDNSKFKLLTIRRLSSETLSQVKERLEEQQRTLERVAEATGQPLPFPYRIVAKSDTSKKNIYAAYIDEDLYGTAAPVYVFTSQDERIKAFVTANGPDKEDYSVHIAHVIGKEKQDDDNYLIDWRIISIDNRLNSDSPSYHILESQSPELNQSFRLNFDIDSLNYIGGGCWSAMSTDSKDRIPVKAALEGTNKDKYFPTSKTWRVYGTSRTLAIVSFSITPSYCFTWCRGRVALTYRARSASHKTDLATLQKEGVIKATRQYTYSLDVPNRPEMPLLGIAPYNHSESAEASATYVSNTNCPEIAGLDSMPDFGTDTRRVAIQAYRQTTNIFRPKTEALSFQSYIDKGIVGNPCFNGVLCASADMASFIKIVPGQASGSITHGFEPKIERASRGFQYGEDYQLWWTYGQVLSYTPTNDGRIFRRVKTAEARGAPSLQPTPDTLYDRGKLQLSEFSNATQTTWPSLKNPPSGFWGLFIGDATWSIEYNNPPIFGHEAVYYYHINPAPPDIDDTLTQVQGGYGEGINNINTLRNVYGQMQGGLGGSSTSNLNIGRTRRNSSANDTLPVLAPSPSQSASMRAAPEEFPSGFWESPIFDENVNADNSSSIVIYDVKANAVKSFTS